MSCHTFFSWTGRHTLDSFWLSDVQSVELQINISGWGFEIKVLRKHCVVFVYSHSFCFLCGSAGLTFRLDWMLRPAGLALHPVLLLRIETSGSDKHNPLRKYFLSRDKLQQLRHNRYNGGGLKDILRVPKHQHEANNVCVGLRITSQVHVCMIPSLIATDLSKWHWCRIAQCLPF